MAVGTLLVDLDGTLWHSLPLYAAILGDVTGNDPDRYLKQLDAGGNVVQLIQTASGVGREGFAVELRRRAPELELYEGVASALRELSARRIPVAAATSLPGWICEPLLEGTNLRANLGVVIHASHARKPNPAVVTKALRKLGSDKAPIWFVGDTETDARCAVRADARFAWASYGYGETEPTAAAATLDRFSEVLEL